MVNHLPETRRYRGQTIAVRKTQRRDQLLDAAIRIYGETGYHNATVKAVCDAAGLTERYFYESFQNSEALLIAAYERVNQKLIEGISHVITTTPGGMAAKAQAALAHYFSVLRQDQRLARLFLLEFSGISPAVERAQGDAQKAFAAWLLQSLDPHEKLPAGERDLLAHGVVGGITSIALCWIRSGHAQPIEALVPVALGFCQLLYRPREESSFL